MKRLSKTSGPILTERLSAMDLIIPGGGIRVEKAVILYEKMLSRL